MVSKGLLQTGIIILLGIPLLASSCIHHSYCDPGTRRQSRARQLEKKRHPGMRDRVPTAAAGVYADVLAGSGVLGGRVMAGLVARGRLLDTHLAAGVALDGWESAAGMSLSAGVRVNWPYSALVRPRIDASFSNFTESLEKSSFSPGWLITGDLGVDLVFVEWTHGEFVLAPMVSLGMTRRDQSVPDGARSLVHSEGAFYIGGLLSLRAVFW